MPTSSPNPPPLPRIDVPVIDSATGRFTVEWYRWLVAWERIWRDIRKEIP
jgi:hypothetical protein